MKILIFIFLFVFSFGENIEKYDVLVNIDNNGDLVVTENILYNFTTPRHGIYRNIPKRDNKLILLGVSMDNNMVESFVKNEEELFIRIGSANKTVISKHLYTIKYKITNEVNKYDSTRNFISFNAIGDEWEVPIKNINITYKITNKIETFEIETFPKLEMIKNGHTISFHKDSLLAYEGIKINIIFPNKYFAENVIKVNNFFAYFTLIVFSLLLYYVYKTQYSQHFGSVKVEYYPPKLNVFKTGLIIDAWVDKKDIGPAILELAQKGYLKIIIEKGIIWDTITLYKLRDSKGLEYEFVLLFDFLFSTWRESFVIGQKNDVLAKKYISLTNSLEEYLYSWGRKEGYFTENILKARNNFLFKVLLIFSPFYLFSIYESIQYRFGDSIMIAMGSVFMFVIFLSQLESIRESKFKLYIAFGIYLSILLIFTFGFNMTLPVSIESFIFLVILFVYMNITDYTQKGLKERRYILGFKEFVKRVEKDKIKRLLKENPHYLDEVIPYALLFGYAKEWEKLYKEFDIKPANIDGGIKIDSISSRDLALFESKNDGDSGFGGSSFSSGSGGGGGGSW